MVETTDIPVGPEECLLSRVFRRLAVGEESSASVKDLHTVSRKEFRKGLIVPSLSCASGEFLIR